MADSAETLKLLIDIVRGGGDGAEHAAKVLMLTKAGAAALAKELDVVQVTSADLDKALGKSASAVKGVGDAGEHASHGISKARLAAEMFRMSSMALGMYIPGLEWGVYGMMSSGEVGILGLIGSLKGLAAVMDDLKAVANLQEVAFKGDADAITAVRKSYEDARIAAALFADELFRQKEAGESAEEVAKRQTDVYKNFSGAAQNLAEARKKLDETVIDSEENQGVISHREAIQKKFDLDVQYARQKLALDAATADGEQKIKERQLTEEKQQLALALQDQVRDQQASANADAKKRQHDARQKIAEKNQTEAEQNLAELGKSHGMLVSGQFNADTVQQLEEFYTHYVGSTAGKSHTEMFDALVKSMKTLTNRASWDPKLTYFLDHTIGEQQGGVGWSKYDLAKTQLEDSKRELFMLSKSEEQTNLAAERAKKQLAATDDAVRTLTKSVETLSRAIPQMQLDSAAKTANAAAVANLTLQADAIGKGLPNPGPIFRAPGHAVEAPAAAAMSNETPWRFSGAQGPAQEVNSQTVAAMRGQLAQSNNHAATMKELAARLEQSNHLNHQTALTILQTINVGLAHQESLQQVVHQIQSQLAGMR
ncbi:MAG: hypothetical protein KGJ13_07370 [Patescibacteria group bacterium]|nr:hypothetical protein [Patescibacteria group bacterium]